MCTLTLAWRVFPNAPVVLVANRDESLSRPSEPPAVRSGSLRVVAPRDAVAGGTWIGASEAGLLAAVTNRWLDADRDGDRSRGLLVDDRLREPSAEAAVRGLLRDLDRHSYDGFTLLLADRVAAFLVAYDGHPTVRRLDPGVHVLGNVGGVLNGIERFQVPTRRADEGAARAASARRIAATLAPEPGESADGWAARAAAVLADHDYGACLHGDGFGTRSCSRIVLGDEPRFEFADGPPCETPLEPVALPAGFGDGDASDSWRGDDAESQF
ncbi:NRDE family protein [Halorubrum vacuolatum]|uniref:Transport and Golgi organisation 2 n=1 Tax=Halorubrum vacuolatum TaxID=63740 RepID=A0A238W8C2_HALVU|nr:NRDE family protein [Halorubrum vacuolatum]SNR41929.1 Transport and Golgi organisation 2 [Halorubrum vacuolatum]